MIGPSDLHKQVKVKHGLIVNRTELSAWLRETRTILADLHSSLLQLALKPGALTEAEIEASLQMAVQIDQFDKQITEFQEACRFHYG